MNELVPENLDLERVLAGVVPIAELYEARVFWDMIIQFWGNMATETEARKLGSKSVRVLDFDIIYPAVCYIDPNNERNLTKGKNESIFPMTARFLFANTKTPFTIPPGAEVELYRFLGELRSKHQLSSEKVLAMWNEIEPGLNNRRVSAGQTKKLISSLRRNHTELLVELEELTSYGERLERLEAILNHEYYISWDKLVGDNDRYFDAEEVNTVWKKLNRERSFLPLNNYLDAINIVTYYSLAETQLNSTRDYIPLLASGTTAVRKFDDYPRRILELEEILSSRDRALTPVSPQYLSFATAVDIHAEFDEDVVATMINTGIATGEKLIEKWVHLKEDIRSKLLRKGADTKSLFVGDLRRFPSFRTFRWAHYEWYEHLRSIGDMFINVARSDRILHENFAASLKQIVCDLQAGQFDEAVEGQGRPLGSLDDRLILQSSVGEVALALRSKDPSQKNDLNLLAAVRTSRAITEITTLTEKPFGNGQQELGEKRFDIQVSVFLTHVRKTFLTWERAHGSKGQICFWPHSSDLSTLMRLASEFLVRVAPAIEPVCVIYFSERERKAFEILPLELRQAWPSKFSASAELEYCRIEAGNVTIFFDVAAVSGAEAPEFAVSFEDPQIVLQISELCEKTSSKMVDKRLAFEILKEYCSRGHDEKWIHSMMENNPRSVYAAA